MTKIPWIKGDGAVSKTDIYYSNKKKLGLSSLKQIKEVELAWFNYFKKNAPCGKILIENNYSKMFSQDKIKLVHITPSLNEIEKTKTIYPSGGGLGTAIYCIPLDSDNTPHNLFNQFFEFQIPKKYKHKLNILYFEVKTKTKNIENWGVDYTRFGEIQCLSWEKIKSAHNEFKKKAKELEEDIFLRMQGITKILNIAIDYDLKQISDEKLFAYYHKIFDTFPSLRFILFEVLAEYILLYQNNEVSLKFLEKGELYNLNHKRVVHKLCPEMFDKFKMTSFKINFKKLVQLLNKKDIITNFKEEHLYHFLKWRISFYIKKMCINQVKKTRDFSETAKEYPSLMGQIIYREFWDKQMFEEYRTPFIYNNIFEENLDLPVYSILPKGEVGINPNIKSKKVRIYEATYNSKKNKIIPGEELKLKLSTKLIPEKKCTIR